MNIYLYNTLSHSKELFKEIQEGKVSMYHCGPTVYDSVHIGNLRTFIFSDILRRIFEYNGYDVMQVMNITDVDDKTIKRSKDEGVTLQDLTEKYKSIFLEDIASLNILRPKKILDATDHISEMIEMIEIMLKNGNAYKASDGIYFKISTSKDYGQLAGIKMTSKTEERIANDDYDKDNPRDFVLWKFSNNEDEPSWPSPFGKGRPGWHIECSAMSTKELGQTIDIHTGGVDLIFPHHVNEIAQSESVSNKQFVNYWLHGGFINVQDEKMSKSKKNFIKLNDLREEQISPLSYRYWLLTAHYRTQVNFTFENVKAGQTALIRLINQFILLGHEDGDINNEYKNSFNQATNDDLDMPKAISIVWSLLKDKNISNKDKRATMLDFDKVLGFNLNEITKTFKMSDSQNEEEPTEEIKALVEAREEARKNKKWDMADALRDEMLARGWNVIDSDSGPKIVKA